MLVQQLNEVHMTFHFLVYNAYDVLVDVFERDYSSLFNAQRAAIRELREYPNAARILVEIVSR
jgi:hypothetical protein